MINKIVTSSPNGSKVIKLSYETIKKNLFKKYIDYNVEKFREYFRMIK